MNKKLILAVLVLAFAGYAAWSFADAVTPYVSISEARAAKSSVQVKGLLDGSAPAPHQEGEAFLFTLKDEETGETLPVRYLGTKPDQFDEAYHIVAIGQCREGEFVANKLLIKCPSKYEQQKPK